MENFIVSLVRVGLKVDYIEVHITLGTHTVYLSYPGGGGGWGGPVKQLALKHTIS